MRRRNLRFTRSPNVACHWEGSEFVLEEFVSRSRIRVSHLAVSILDAFSEPRSLEEAARLFPAYTPSSVRREMRSLARFGFLVPSTRRVADASKEWKGAFAAAYLHFSTKSERYLETPEDELAYYLRRLSEERQPPLFKTYPRARRLALGGGAGGALAGALEARMTHRRFGRRPVTFEELSTLLSRTFGRAGWVDGGVLGKKLAKTSPSAGARHPIECYALVWNVEGVPPGIYHYGVKHDALERLERCDPRGAVVAFTSGQRWIARAGFACVLTAVAARTLWKYPASGAYRLLLLDAGHLAQTFLLLAAEAGLGGFVTAALQHDEIERRLRLDGLAELPLYICGAGASVSKGATLRLTG